MTPVELMAAARRWLNDEVVATYKWTTAELVDYYNYTLDEIARETDYFSDPTTVACINLSLTAGTGDYAFDTRVLEIKAIAVAGELNNLYQTTTRLRSLEYPSWRYGNSVSGIDITFTAATIASVVTDFIEAGFTAGEFYQVLGSSVAGNNKVVKIETVEQHLLTLSSGYSLTISSTAVRIVIKQMTTGTPLRYMTDYLPGYITLDPAPNFSGSLLMDVIRLQAVLLTAAEIVTPSSYTIPVNYQYHLQLVDGILSKAYLKSGPSTFNIEKSEVHRKLFMALKDRIKKDMGKIGATQSTLRPHEGNI